MRSSWLVGERLLAALPGPPAQHPRPAVMGPADAISTSPLEQSSAVKAGGSISLSLHLHSHNSHHARRPTQKLYSPCTWMMCTMLLPRGSVIP